MTIRLDRPLLRPGDPDYRPGVVPRDAATLIVVRFDDDIPRVLMGRRNAKMRFMPGKLVFPGGRADPSDRNAPSADTMSAHQEAALLFQMRGRTSPARARGLVLAAVRETYEETGFMLGRRNDPVPDRGKGRGAGGEAWKPFRDLGVTPQLDPVHFLARAITPPGMVRRFDTRFFMTSADNIALHGDVPCPDELMDPGWLSFAEARASDPAPITDIILSIAESKLDGLAGGRVQGPLSFFSVRNGRAHVDQIPL